MRAAQMPMDEQYRLIMECRSSGLTDHQWCLEHGIKSGTFYNWVRRLRMRGCTDIPAAHVRQTSAVQQEIVKVEITPPVPTDSFRNASTANTAPMFLTEAVPVMELRAGEKVLRIPNGTDPLLARLAISLIGGIPC